MHHFLQRRRMEEKQTWFWRKEADGCADLLCWLRESGEGKAYGDAGFLCWFPGSEESEADGDGGFLCYFLVLEKIEQVVAQLLCWCRVFWWSLGSSVGFAFSLFSLLSYSLPLPLSSLHSLLSVFFSFMSRCLLLLLLFSFPSPGDGSYFLLWLL